MTGVVWDWKLLVLIAEYWSLILSEYMYVHSNNQIQNRYSSCMSLGMVKKQEINGTNFKISTCPAPKVRAVGPLEFLSPYMNMFYRMLMIVKV